MTCTHHISNQYTFEDKNITFQEKNQADYCVIKGIKYIQLHATLTYHPSSCEKCGCSNDNHTVIKHGFKHCSLRLGDLDYTPTHLKLKKQRFLCKACGNTFTASTPLFDKGCHISNIIKRKITDYLRDEVAMKTIAKHLCVSPHTVLRHMMKTADAIDATRLLPSVICMDEFYAKKNQMSFVFVNADTHQIMDILPSRKLDELIAYFQRYSYEQRAQVKYIIMDMYKPYMSLVRSCFPNAQVIIDTFHVVQHLNRALNRIRVETMIQLRYSSPRDYCKLKQLWLLVLKNRESLDFENYKGHRLFDGLVSEKRMVDYLVQLSPNFLHAYEIINDLKYDIEVKRDDFLSEDLQASRKISLRRYVRTTLQTLSTYLEGIQLGLRTAYTNGVIEGLNNRIKNIKRSGYGYSNFSHLRARILIINRLTVKPIQNKRIAEATLLPNTNIHLSA